VRADVGVSKSCVVGTRTEVLRTVVSAKPHWWGRLASWVFSNQLLPHIFNIVIGCLLLCAVGCAGFGNFFPKGGKGPKSTPKSKKPDAAPDSGASKKNSQSSGRSSGSGGGSGGGGSSGKGPKPPPKSPESFEELMAFLSAPENRGSIIALGVAGIVGAAFLMEGSVGASYLLLSSSL
jgi:hypothetical protein